jgi:hypothetical protein
MQFWSAVALVLSQLERGRRRLLLLPGELRRRRFELRVSYRLLGVALALCWRRQQHPYFSASSDGASLATPSALESRAVQPLAHCIQTGFSVAVIFEKCRLFGIEWLARA